MKPLSELHLNKHSILTATPVKATGKAKRPALELLNQLNDKLTEENSSLQYRKEITRLGEENRELKQING